MKQKKVDPTAFDGEKFAQRYGLGADDFRMREGVLHYPDALPGGDALVIDAPTAGGKRTPYERLLRLLVRRDVITQTQADRLIAGEDVADG